jgi:hypothetical protein
MGALEAERSVMRTPVMMRRPALRGVVPSVMRRCVVRSMVRGVVHAGMVPTVRRRGVVMVMDMRAGPRGPVRGVPNHDPRQLHSPRRLHRPDSPNRPRGLHGPHTRNPRRLDADEPCHVSSPYVSREAPGSRTQPGASTALLRPPPASAGSLQPLKSDSMSNPSAPSSGT